jgi:hypothetical protein
MSLFFKPIRLLLLLSTLTCGHAAIAQKIPSEDEREVLIKSSLMTLNDANLTGNYQVFCARASRQFQTKCTGTVMADAFRSFRDNKMNMESIVADEIHSMKEMSIDKDGVLLLKGRFKDDDKRISFDLKFVKNEAVWKLLGIAVNYKSE